MWETSQTLFWAAFGLIDLDNFELTGIKEFTRFWGLIMFGSFSLINIIVLLNLLIAMMNHSYQLISVSSVRLKDFILLTSILLCSRFVFSVHNNTSRWSFPKVLGGVVVITLQSSRWKCGDNFIKF